MKKYRNTIFYISTIGVFTALMYWIVSKSAILEIGRNIIQIKSNKSQWQEFVNALVENLQHPLAILLAQIITIISVARIFGWICKKIGQPTVIGEIIAGVVLGPSLVGHYFPEFSATLFPEASLGNLQFLSQIGLILFMFVIGMELDLKALKNKANDAIVISHSSILFTFTLALTLAYVIYEEFAPMGVQFLSFGLFLGVAMSITAFPVLARIVQERGIHKTKLGTIAVTIAAVDDITAWCILAAVIAIVKAGTFVSALYVIALLVVYVFFMLKVVRPFLKRVGDLHSTRENLGKPIVAIFLITLILSSYATEIIGVHALFGAFMAGIIMPENAKFRNLFIEKVEDVAIVLLLPLFFVLTGLRTQIGLINDIHLWKITGLIMLVAVGGKLIGSSLISRFVGQSWKESFTIGALINTRGLMELVVLNIGYDLGVISSEIFAMMVIMALSTTFMTGPALDFINWIFKSKKITASLDENDSKYRILVSFGTSERGKSLLRLSNEIIRKTKRDGAITAMHLTQSNEVHQFNINQIEKESFTPVINEAKKLNIKIDTLFKATTDINSDIADIANKGNYNLLLMGVGKSIFEGSLLGKILGFTTRIINPDRLISQATGKENLFENSPFDERTRLVLSKSNIPVGVLVDKGFQQMDHLFVPIFSENDLLVIQFAKKLLRDSNTKLSLLDATGQINSNEEIKNVIAELQEKYPTQISILNKRVVNREFLREQHLMLTCMENWKQLLNTKSLWLADTPSTLILSDKS